MTSPNLNNLILLGSIFVYLSILVAGMDKMSVRKQLVNASCSVSSGF